MAFHRKIYYNDKPLVLTTDAAAYINANSAARDYHTFAGAERDTLKRALRRLDETNVAGALLLGNMEKELLHMLQAAYSLIDAGGGIVYNEDGAILMIFRRGKWDLPKGKLDEGEQIDACALREVTEETGLQQLTLQDKICDTYHIYSQKGEKMLKRTAWYKMAGHAAEKLTPQKEENILEARWISPKDLAPFAAKTYEAIREVLHSAGLDWE